MNVAVKAARQAGALMVRYMTQNAPLAVEAKTPRDFVSRLDRESEQSIIEWVQKRYPQHAILGEESGLLDPLEDGEQNNCLWVIDPLDGTNNAIHGIPHFCISIGIRVNDKVQHGVIYDPLRDELFTASKGSGAYLNQRRLRLGREPRTQESLIALGSPVHHLHRMDSYVQLFKAMAPQVSGIRHTGSAALDLAYVAAGRLDGYVELDLQPWDVCAGVLIAREAGATVCDPRGDRDACEHNGHVVAGRPKMHALLMSAYKEANR